MPDDSVWLCCRSCGTGRLYCKLSFGIEAYVNAPGTSNKRHEALVGFIDEHLQCGMDAVAESQSVMKTGMSLVAFQFERNIGLFTERSLEWVGDAPEGGSACRLKSENLRK